MAPAHESTCKPMADWMRICRQDFAAIVGITFFIIYVLWGVTPTLRGFRWLRTRLSRKAGGSETTSKDLEEEFNGQDPYHSPTLLLKRYLTRSAHTVVPPATYLPTLMRNSPELPTSLPPNYSSIPQEQLQERLRLAQFRFPASRRTSAPPLAVPDLFAPSARSSRCSDETDLETLGDFVLNSSDLQKKCPDEELYDERPTVMRRESVARLPSIPPPAYLDLDRQMEPERFEYSAV